MYCLDLENVISVTICENQHKTISCEGGTAISVLEASYGRHDRQTCPSEFIRTTNCNAGSSLSIVQSNCDDQASCNLFASNSVFGDPCFGTFKYLQVKYKCIGGTVTRRWCEWAKVVCFCSTADLLLRKQKFDTEKNLKEVYTLVLGLVPSDSGILNRLRVSIPQWHSFTQIKHGHRETDRAAKTTSRIPES